MYFSADSEFHATTLLLNATTKTTTNENNENMTDISASKRESLPGWEPGSVAALAAVAASSSSGGPYPTVGLYSNQPGSNSSSGSNSGGNGGPLPPPHLPSPYSSFSQPIPSSSASSSTPYAQPQGIYCNL